ncbi:MAG: bifunctional adenosylcobinamide kinase/adenosylcobinamide-phosphate guanylyltransferase [Acidimicrobiales bacterium]
MSVTMVLGGARSGKSAVAERLAGDGPVTYLATFVGGPEDRDMAARVAAHQARRPASWTTVETSDLVAAVRAAGTGTLMIDSLATWVAGAPGFAVDTAGLCLALGSHAGEVIVVSDEVGLGVHPSSEEGRRFRDALGMVNQAVTAVADETLLVIAGRVVRLDPA